MIRKEINIEKFQNPGRVTNLFKCNIENAEMV